MTILNNVVFVLEQYERCTPEWGPSTYSVLPETLTESGFAEKVTTFYSDSLARQMGQTGAAELLLETCVGERLELLVFVPTGWPQIDPPRYVIKTIGSMGTKVYLVRGDAEGFHGRRFNASWFPFVDYIGFADMSVSSLGYNQPKAIQAFPCRSGKQFYDMGLERDIDVSFVGAVAGKREEYISFLREHGINVVTIGGLELDKRVPIEEYVRTLNRSKISLSFCTHTGEGFAQLKGRVLEIMMCGAMMIEDTGTETVKFFDDGKDFIMCPTKEKMLEKVKYYLGHAGEAVPVSMSGNRKVAELYNSKNLWAHILESIGFSLPDEITKDKNYLELSRKLERIRGGL